MAIQKVKESILSCRSYSLYVSSSQSLEQEPLSGSGLVRCSSDCRLCLVCELQSIGKSVVERRESVPIQVNERNA